MSKRSVIRDGLSEIVFKGVILLRKTLHAALLESQRLYLRAKAATKFETTLLSRIDDYDDCNHLLCDDWDLLILKIRFKEFIFYPVMLHEIKMLVWHKYDCPHEE